MESIAEEIKQHTKVCNSLKLLTIIQKKKKFIKKRLT